MSTDDKTPHYVIFFLALFPLSYCRMSSSAHSFLTPSKCSFEGKFIFGFYGSK